MGFLTDLGNVAVGAIERDREITKEDLAIRAENLQANRQILIKQKSKKYDKELDAYYKEKEKFDNINDMNNRFKTGTIDKGTYAAFALSSTMPGWDKLSKERKYELETNFDGKTIDYKLVGSPEEINKKAAAAQTLINNETSKAIKDAKGNSFLINQILGKKETAEKDLLAAVESKLNAAETVKLTEKSTDNSGLDVKVGGNDSITSWANWEKKNKDWVKRYTTLKDKIVYKSASQNNNFLNFMTTSDLMGASSEANFKLTNNDTQIEGLNDSARAMLKSYEMVYNSVVNDIYAKELAGSNVSITELDKYVSTAEVNKRVQNLIEQRGFRVDIGDGIGGGKQVDFIGVVPLNVINRNGGFVLDSGAVKNLNMDYVKQEYQLFLETEGDKLIASSPKRFESSTNKKAAAMSIIQSSIENDGKYSVMFNGSLKVDRDNPDTPENENITMNPKVIADEKLYEKMAKEEGLTGNSVIKLNDDGKIIPQTEGKFGTDKTRITLDPNNKGFKQNGKMVLWENLEKRNMIDKLPNFLKLRYQTWKSQQGKKNSNITEDFNTNGSIDNDMVFSSMIENIEKDFKSKKKK